MEDTYKELVAELKERFPDQEFLSLSESLLLNLDIVSSAHSVWAERPPAKWLPVKNLEKAPCRLVIAQTYNGMGHMRVLGYDFEEKKFFTCIGGGANGYDRIINWTDMLVNPLNEITPEKFFETD
jgi:hypothetical protein